MNRNHNDSIAQVSTISSNSAIEVTISEAYRVNDSAEGHAIYKDTATLGEYKCDIRYFSVLKISMFLLVRDYNLTCRVDSFKFF